MRIPRTLFLEGSSGQWCLILLSVKMRTENVLCGFLPWGNFVTLANTVGGLMDLQIRWKGNRAELEMK